MNNFAANVCANLTADQLIRLQYELCFANWFAFEQCTLIYLAIQKWL